MKHLFLGLFIVLAFQGITQAPSLKELEIERILQIAKVHPTLDTAILLSQEALLSSRSINYQEGIISAYQLLAVSEFKKENFAGALTNYLQLMPLLKKTNKTSEIINTYIAIGDIHYLENLFEQALAYYTEAEVLLLPQSQENKLLILEKMATAYYKSNQPEKALSKLNTMYQYYQSRNMLSETIGTLEKKVDNYLLLKNYDDAIADNQRIIGLVNQKGDTKEMAIAFNNLAYVYLKLKNYQKAINNFDIARNMIKSSSPVQESDILVNKAICFNNMGDPDNALLTLRDAQSILPKDQYEKLGSIYQLISTIYLNKKDYFNALQYSELAIQFSKQAKSADQLSDAYRQAGVIYEQLYVYEKALDFYDKHLGIRDSLRVLERLRQQEFLQQQMVLEKVEKEIQIYQINEQLKDLALQQSELERQSTELKLYNLTLEDNKKADELELLKRERQIKDAEIKTQILENQRRKQELLLAKKALEVEQRDNEFADLQQKAEIQRMKIAQITTDENIRLKEIESLTKEREISNLRLITQRRSNQLAYGIGLALLVISLLGTIGYWTTRRTNKKLAQQNIEIERQRAIVEMERQQSEQLLLNILPEPTAIELKNKGYATPKKYELATVLFTDFNGFTTISEQLSPEELVGELNECFIAFDDIIERYGLEKIKTIGDGYMCVGGVPIPNTTNPVDAVKAALEMRNFISKVRIERLSQGKTYWQMRVGVHTGELVAGVVGKKKFVYDIWGDAVNVASRMETNGIEGTVNISKATHELVKDHFNCTYRGAIEVKNKGKVEMYIVEEKQT